MAEITKIKAQKNKKRVNIYLDGKFTFPLDADNFLKAGLKIGQELTEKQVEDLVFKNEFQKLYDKTVRLIAARPRSEKEIHDYLKKKIWNLEFEIWKFREGQLRIKDKLMEDIVKSLKKQNLINDMAFAGWWVEQRSTFRPRGKFGLTMELRQKGINQDTIDKVVEQVNELALARKVAQKKAKTYQKLDRQEFREKMSAFLARRGFSWSVIKQVIDHVKRS